MSLSRGTQALRDDYPQGVIFDINGMGMDVYCAVLYLILWCVCVTLMIICCVEVSASIVQVSAHQFCKVASLLLE